MLIPTRVVHGDGGETMSLNYSHHSPGDIYEYEVTVE
jgi:hypothetical protein